MKAFALITLLSLPAWASAPAQENGSPLLVRVGEERGLPAENITTVTVGDVEVLQVIPPSGTPYIKLKGRKAGRTNIVLKTSTGRRIVHAVTVR